MLPLTTPTPSQVLSLTTELNDTVSNELVDSQGPFSYVTPSLDQDVDDTTLGKLFTEAHREHADYLNLEGVFVSPSSVSVASDRMGKPVARVTLIRFVLVSETRAVLTISFLQSSKLKKWSTERRLVGKSTGTTEERNIRTLFNEQREMIIVECCEKVSHHELQTTRAEQNHRILQEELRRQQKDFREVHQQNLTEMEKLQIFQNSTFDEFAQKKFIKDQKIILELSGRLQEPQNEVNCMNDSKDFRDAESICSGNSHVTSPPRVFPKHLIPEGLRPSRHLDTPGISRNVVGTPTSFLYSSLSSRIESMEEENH